MRNAELIIAMKSIIEGGYSYEIHKPFINSKEMLSKIGFCMLVRNLVEYRSKMKKPELSIRVIEDINSDVDIVIEGQSFKLIGSEGASFIQNKNVKEFILPYETTGRIIMFRVIDKSNSKLFLSADMLNASDMVWRMVIDKYEVPEDVPIIEDTPNTKEEVDTMPRDEQFDVLTNGDVAMILNVPSHKISNALSIGKVIYESNSDVRYIGLKRLLKFITSDKFTCDDTYPKLIPVAGIKKGLKLETLSFEGQVFGDDERIFVEVLCKILELMISEYTRQESEEPVTETSTETTIESASPEFDVNDISCREDVIANLFNKYQITPDNIIFNLNQLLFTTPEELAVLQYMRGNLCDIILFMIPEMRKILRLLEVDEFNGYLVPKDYENKIRIKYPTMESISNVTIQEIEEILFPGVLLMKCFRGSLFLFIDSIYAGIDPASITHMSPDEFTSNHILTLINRLTPLLDKTTVADRVALFKALGTTITSIERRDS